MSDDVKNPEKKRSRPRKEKKTPEQRIAEAIAKLKEIAPYTLIVVFAGPDSSAFQYDRGELDAWQLDSAATSMSEIARLEIRAWHKNALIRAAQEKAKEEATGVRKSGIAVPPNTGKLH